MIRDAEERGRDASLHIYIYIYIDLESSCTRHTFPTTNFSILLAYIFFLLASFLATGRV